MYPYKIENSPEYDAQIEQWRKDGAQKRKQNDRLLKNAKKLWGESKTGWLPMDSCPFGALDDEYGFAGAILVTDGAKRALATVNKRFGTPVFYKTEPEYVMRDGMMCGIGGEEDPRDDLPKWWWTWEIVDEFGSMTYAGGEETGKDEVDFVPTLWSFLQAPPAPAQPEGEG